MTSTYLKALLLAILLMLFNACEEDTIPSTSCDSFVQLDAEKYQNGATEFYSIISATIVDDCLEIKYSSSGCDGNSWKEEMIDAEAILESFPIQRNLKMLLENNEACAAVFTKTVSFDLRPIQTEDYSKIKLNLEGWDQTLVYLYGSDTTIEEQIQQKWDLVNVNGGLAGIDTDFPAGSIVWSFGDSEVEIANNHSVEGALYDGFDSGTYDYSINDGNGFQTLVVNDQELGVVKILEEELVVDQRAVDGFQLRFTVH